MSYQERRSLFNIFLSIITSLVYGLIILSRYNNGLMDTSNMFRFWSIVILLVIPVTIVSKIIALIIFRIFGEIFDEISGKKEDRDIVDERDKLIELKSDRFSQYVFALGFILGLVSQLFTDNVSYFFIIMISGGFLSELSTSIMQIVYYRKGV